MRPRSASGWAAILLANTALTAASAPITAIIACGSAIVASGSKPGPHIAYRPAPYALRNTTHSFGTVASATAEIIFAPCRMIPWRSTPLPIMKPGTSARNTSGSPNASHSQMKRAALSAESTNSTPPFHFGWLATMPTARPSRRAKPVTSSRANSFLSSKKLPSSTSASMTSWMPNA